MTDESMAGVVEEVARRSAEAFSRGDMDEAATLYARTRSGISQRSV